MVTNAVRKFKLEHKTAEAMFARDLALGVAYLKRDDLIRPGDKKTERVIVRNSTRRRFEPGEQVYPLDNASPSLLLLHGGTVELFLPSQPTRILVKRIEEGSLFGEMPSIGFVMMGTQAQAVSQVEILVFDESALKQVEQKARDIASRLLHLIGPRLAICQREYERTKFATLLARIASLLLDRADESGLVRGINQRIMADRLGARRESVVAAISEMKRSKLIDVRGRENYVLTDIPALNQLRLF
jgi:CRP-like cAMP-binding protein